MRALGIFKDENDEASPGLGLGVGLGLGSGLTSRNSMPHFGQRPRLVDVTSGCIGHAYTTFFATGFFGLGRRVCGTTAIGKLKQAIRQIILST